MFQFVYSNSRDSSSFSFSIFYSKNFKKCSFISSVTYIREFSKFEKYFNLVQNSKKKKYIYIFVATLKNINKFHKYRYDSNLLLPQSMSLTRQIGGGPWTEVFSFWIWVKEEGTCNFSKALFHRAFSNENIVRQANGIINWPIWSGLLQISSLLLRGSERGRVSG